MNRLLSLSLVLVLVLACPQADAAHRIQHLEPASWWVGMKDDRLQLLVHGERIAELEPALSYPGVRLARVARVENANYLFLDLVIGPETRPGRFRIDFRRGGKSVVRHEYALEAREAGSSERRSFDGRDAIYLITPDRFANGDPGNDRVAGMREGPGRDEPDGRHGGDLQGIRERLDYIAGLGFTQIWLNPVLENDQPEASYHGYAITDFYRIDPRFGSNELYRTLAREARAKGIGIIKDVVLNHCGSEHWWMKDLPSRDWINHGGSFVQSTHNHDSLHDPHGVEEDRRGLDDGWFVPTMPDLNQRNPLLMTYLVQNAIWWIEYAGLSGLRVDTWPYSERHFLAEWTRRLLQEYPGLNMAGEEWVTNPALLARWQRGSEWADGYESLLPGLMDFPLQDAVRRGLTEEEGWDTGLRRIWRTLADDFVYPNADNLVVFPENHDMSRVYTQLGERLDLYKMAIAFFATTRGIPHYYYGSEILMTNPGTDAHGVIRADFPGGWPADASDAFSGKGLSARQREAQEFTRKLLNWRKGASAVHRGKLTHYAPRDGVYVYFRHDDGGKVMVVISKAATAQGLDMKRFARVIGASVDATDVLTGRQLRLGETLEVPARSVTVLELRGGETIPAGVTGTIERIEKFPSTHVAPRQVDVWLPPSYGDASRRFPVLYMHDGQNLFDPALSYTKVDWGIDETMTRLIGEGAIREAIVVGIWNTPKRGEEYIPQKAVSGATVSMAVPGMPELSKMQIVSDEYLKFIVQELKPFVDTKYRTRPGRADTFIMGSSAGALISIYALTEYPDVFGGAGGVSTHWPLGDGILVDYLERNLPKRGRHKLYFDYGTATLDYGYEPYQRRVDALMRRAGWREGVDWLTVKDEGAEHNEAAWRARVHQPLTFFLKKK